MKLPVSTLSEGENRLRFQSTQDGWLKQLQARIEKEGDYRFEAPLDVDVRLTKLEPDYYLKGQMNFSLALPCARCAERFKLPMQPSFEMALSQVAAAKAASDKISEESDELDIIFFTGNEIDLEPVIEEQFFLSLPYQPLCSEECQGVCQKCGRNLNQGRCDCKPGLDTNPFSILKQIKH